MSTTYKIYGAGPPDSPAVPTLAVTGANTYYSESVGVPDGKAVSYQVRFGGTPTGTLSLWYSNMRSPNLANDADWVQDTTFVPTNPAGTAPHNFYTVGNLTARSTRLKYVNSAGSGTLAAWATVGTER